MTKHHREMSSPPDTDCTERHLSERTTLRDKAYTQSNQKSRFPQGKRSMQMRRQTTRNRQDNACMSSPQPKKKPQRDMRNKKTLRAG